jgi:hypothetical protein
LARLTLQVAYNDNFPIEADPPARRPLMAFLRQHSKHAIYVIKENRTYDQVLGDLPRGNGDASLALFPETIAPNRRAGQGRGLRYSYSKLLASSASCDRSPLVRLTWA